jgi:hypothetical protein
MSKGSCSEGETGLAHEKLIHTFNPSCIGLGIVIGSINLIVDNNFAGDDWIE